MNEVLNYPIQSYLYIAPIGTCEVKLKIMTDRPTDRPTEGHEGSEVGFTSN